MRSLLEIFAGFRVAVLVVVSCALLATPLFAGEPVVLDELGSGGLICSGEIRGRVGGGQCIFLPRIIDLGEVGKEP